MYYGDSEIKLGYLLDKQKPSQGIKINKIEVEDIKTHKTGIIRFQNGIKFSINIFLKRNVKAVIGISITNKYGVILTSIHTKELNKNEKSSMEDQQLSSGKHGITLKLENIPLRPGEYTAYCSLFSRENAVNIYSSAPIPFLIEESGDIRNFDERQQGEIFPVNAVWELK